MKGLKVPRISDLGVVYPVLLLALPNSIQFPSLPAAPETLLLFALFPIMLLADRTRLSNQFSVSLSEERLQILGFLLLGVSLIVWAAKGEMGHVARVAIWGVTFLFGLYYAARIRRVLTLWRAWLAIATLAALIFLLDPSRWGEKTVNILAWEHRTTYAYFLAVPIVVLLFQALSGPTLHQLYRASLLLVLLPALMLSYSRGAWLVVVMGVGALLFLAGRTRQAWMYTIFGSALAVFALTTVETEVVQLVRSIYDWDIRSSALYRFDIYFAGFTAISETGLWGAGPSSVGQILADHTLQTYGTLDEDKFATDSDVIWLLVEAGVVGAIGLMVTLFSYASQLVGGRKFLAMQDTHLFTAAVFFSLLGWIVFDNVLMTPFGWFLLGSLCGGFGLIRAAIVETPRCDQISKPAIS